MINRSDQRVLWEQRIHGFELFEQWERDHACKDSAAEALSLAAGLYELLPREARMRPVTTEGVVEMHRQLAVLR